MQCPKCQHINRDGAKFCEECGEKLQTRCPKCGSELRPKAKFCDECGARVADSIPEKSPIPKLEDMHKQLQSMIPDALAQKYLAAEKQITGENRPITALFADISGSTQLAFTKTSEAMFQLVQDCFKELVGIIANYEGRISGFRGDGLLALFGAPILHENDAERAILAALEMHKAMQKQQLKVTIGINTAMMTVGEIQTQLYSEYTAYGTDIVLARRLQENAQPGQILVGSGTYRLTRQAFDFEALKPISVKGFPQPVSAYIVKQVKSHPEKLRGIEGLRARMIGREHEFTELKEATDEWLAGHGQIVSIIGEAGIGKSRLVRELREYLEDQKAGVLVMEGRCVSIGQPISYWPFIDILKTYFKLSEGDDTAAIARKVTDSITQLIPQGADETLPLLGQLLSVKFGNELDDRLKFATPEQIRHQTLMRLRDIFETLAKQKPLLLILEDLHWSDELSLSLISLLMDELANTPLMLLCVYRPDKEHQVSHLSDQAQRKCLDRYTEILLRKLNTVESRQLVEELLTIDNLPENVKNLILTKSEGNPFFIEEVIRSLIDRNLVYHDADRWKARDEASSIDVPDTIQSVILSRVDRLQAEAKYVLQCASVIGRLFKYRLLEHLAQHERNLNSYLSEFEERDLVYPEHILPELEYAFKHALTQEATYQSILERKRKEFHLQVAQGIERLYQERLEEFYDELAEHYSKAQYADKTIEYLVKAGNKAKQNYANESAILYYQKALGFLDRIEHPSDLHLNWKLELLENLGEVCGWLSRMAESEDAYRKAIELAKMMKVNSRQLARLYHGISLGPLFWQNKFDEALQYGKMGLEILGEDTKCIEAATLNTTIALSYNYKGNRKKADEYTRRNMNFIKTLPYSKWFMPIYNDISLMVLTSDRDLESALERTEELERLARKNNDLNTVAESWRIHSLALCYEGDYKNALLFNRKALELFRRTGFSLMLPKCLWMQADILITLGIADEAEPLGHEAITVAEKSGNRSDVSAGHAYLGSIYGIKHEWEKAIFHYEKNLALPQEFNRIKWTLFYLGKIYMYIGDYVRAIKIFTEVAENVFSSMDQDWQLNYAFYALIWIEECYIALGKQQDFLNFRKDLLEKYKETIQKFPVVQCYLEKVSLTERYDKLIFQDDFSSNKIEPSWNWIDKFNDQPYKFHNGLVICAANGRGLFDMNQSAPRLLHEISGDFAVEVCISPAFDDRPQIGGILVWKDKGNFIRFEKGYMSLDRVAIGGYSEGKGQLTGQVLMKAHNTYMRVERSGSQFNAYCSIDGENWIKCGKIDLLVDDPVQVGVYASGFIDRAFWPEEYKEGTATLFKNFRIWTR